MQFYLPLVLSGIISGSTVLAQAAPVAQEAAVANEVTGYASPGCTESTTFTYTATDTFKCIESTTPGTKSVNVPQGVRCSLFASTGCSGSAQLIGAPACVELTIPDVKSFACILYNGPVN